MMIEDVVVVVPARPGASIAVLACDGVTLDYVYMVDGVDPHTHEPTKVRGSDRLTIACPALPGEPKTFNANDDGTIRIGF